MIPNWAKSILGLDVKPKPSPGSYDHARDLLAQSWEAYRLARKDRPREAHQPHGYSGDAAVIGSHDLMHRRTRDMARNTAQTKKIKRAFENLVIGRGMQTFAWPFLPSEMFEIITEIESIQDGAIGPRLQYALESDDLFEEYFHDKNQFDAENRLSGPEMYRMLIGESVLVGNGLLVRVLRPDYDPDRHRVPVAWQMFEREQLDQSQDRPSSEGKNKIVGGLEINSLNQVVAYHLYLDHPHDFFGVSQSSLVGVGMPTSLGGRSVRVRAERVIDLALYDRPSSSLGHSWMDAIGQSVWDRDGYMESEMRTAAAESAFLLVAKLMHPEKYSDWGFDDGTDNTDDYGNQEFRLGYSSAAAVIGKDESIDLVKSQRPNKDAPPFIKVFDRDIAGGIGLGYYTLTDDYEGTNFSSSRASKLDEDLNIAPLQQWFGFNVALPIRRTFNILAAATGQFQSIRQSEYRANIRRYNRFDVIANGRDLLDPFKEGEARTARMRTFMSTFKEECAKRNQHWIRVLMQRAIEEKVFDLFGVKPDISKGGSGDGSGQSAPGQVGDGQAEEIADRVVMLLEERLS